MEAITLTLIRCKITWPWHLSSSLRWARNEASPSACSQSFVYRCGSSASILPAVPSGHLSEGTGTLLTASGPTRLTATHCKCMSKQCDASVPHIVTHSTRMAHRECVQSAHAESMINNGMLPVAHGIHHVRSSPCSQDGSPCTPLHPPAPHCTPLPKWRPELSCCPCAAQP